MQAFFPQLLKPEDIQSSLHKTKRPSSKHGTLRSSITLEKSISLKDFPVADPKICLNHKLRTFCEESTIIHPLKNFQAWIKAGELDPDLPARSDRKLNSTTWRNFSGREVVQHNGNENVITPLVACMYPVNIPAPSRMGNYTFIGFIENNRGLFSRETLKYTKIAWTEHELERMRRSKVSFKTSVPPTDDKSKVISPRFYRRLQAQGRIRHLPSLLDNSYPGSSQRRMYTSGFSPSTSVAASRSSLSTSIGRKGLLWKYSYKLNNPG